MSLIQRVTALAQAVAADIKALYTGKAEKEHTHTAAQVSGLGTAATKDVQASIYDGVDGSTVMLSGAYGLGSTNLPNTATPTADTRTGFYNNGTSNHIQLTRVGSAGRYGFRFSVSAPSGAISVTPYYAGESQPTISLYSTLNTLNIGKTKATALTALNLTQQEKAIKDPSGLWVESGALTNDMSSYLSSKTYAEMRTKLGVVPVNVVQSTGTSTENVISQKAVTDAFKVIEDALGFLLLEEGEGATLDFWINGLSSDMDTYRGELIAKIEALPAVNVVQATGTSTEDVMSQKAVTDTVANHLYSLMGLEDGWITSADVYLHAMSPDAVEGYTMASEQPYEHTVALRSSTGTLRVSPALVDNEAVNLAQLNTAIAAVGGGGGGIAVVQKDGFSASAVMSQYAVTGFMYELSALANINRLYCSEQHAALHALNPATATLPQLITALQSVSLLDIEHEMPPPEP